jgi:hypothetical protein
MPSSSIAGLQQQDGKKESTGHAPSKSLENFARSCANATAPSRLYPTNATPQPIPTTKEAPRASRGTQGRDEPADREPFKKW